MYMLIIVDVIDIFFLFAEKHCRGTLCKEEDTKGTCTLDQCSDSLFYAQLSHILNFQTLLLMDSTSLVTWSRNIVIDLQSPEMHNGHGQRKQASSSGKNKRKLEFWCVSPGKICIFMYNPELEYRGTVREICTFVCTCTWKMFLIHVHWQAIDGPSIFVL